MTISKGKKAILTAGLSVGVAVLLLSYAAYGWFTSTSTVTATGMTMSASAPNSIQISLVGDDDDKNWSDKVDVNVKEILKKQPGLGEMSPNSNLYILPASTLAGFDNTFFATISAKSNGQFTDDAVFTEGKPVHKATDGYEGHYVDIPLYFRNQGEDLVTLALDKNGDTNSKPTAITTEKKDNEITKIARVAFLDENKTLNSMKATTPLVLAGDGANTIQVVTGIDAPAVLEESKYLEFDAVTKLSKAGIIKVEPAVYGGENGTEYKVASMIVRIWIEGQDQACTVKVGNQIFKVDLKFTVK